MKKTLIIFSLAAVLISCHSTINTTTSKGNQNSTDKLVLTLDTVPKVIGIGGIFFFSDNPQKTNEWYEQNLGLVMKDYGSVFESRDVNHPDVINYLIWSTFEKGSDYLSPSKKDFMINYRVQNIEGLVKKLKANGAIVLDSIATYDYGKFVHLLDLEGNKIELWEPVDSVLTKIGGETTK